MRRRLGTAGLLACLLAAACAGVHMPVGEPRLRAMLESALPGAQVWELQPGVALAKSLVDGPQALHVLAVDLYQSDLYFRPILASGTIDGGPRSRETLSAMARRTGAIAAINADFAGDPLNVTSLTVIDGKVHYAPREPGRSSLAISRKNEVLMGRLAPDAGYYQVIGGGPLLMRDGVFLWSVDERGRINGEEFSESVSDVGAPRAWTVAALRGDGRTLLWIVGARGPAWYSRGFVPEEIGAILRALDCTQAIAFEGGAVSGLYADGRRVNAPPGEPGAEEPLGSALGLYALR